MCSHTHKQANTHKHAHEQPQYLFLNAPFFSLPKNLNFMIHKHLNSAQVQKCISQLNLRERSSVQRFRASIIVSPFWNGKFFSRSMTDFFLNKTTPPPQKKLFPLKMIFILFPGPRLSLLQSYILTGIFVRPGVYLGKSQVWHRAASALR